MALDGYTVHDPHRAYVAGYLQNHPSQTARLAAGADGVRGEDYGMRSILFIAGGAHGGAPTEGQLRHYCRLAIRLNRFMVRNDESVVEPSRGGEEEIAANVRRLLWEAEVIRSETPHLAWALYNQPSTIGTFDPLNNTDRMRRLRENFARLSWYRDEGGRRDNRGLIAAQPYLAPSLYQPKAANQPIHFERWYEWARVVVDLCHEYHKLAIPFLSMNYQGHPGMGVLPAQAFADQTRWCIENASGVIWWSFALPGATNWDQRHEACYEAGMEVLRDYGLDVPMAG